MPWRLGHDPQPNPTLTHTHTHTHSSRFPFQTKTVGGATQKKWRFFLSWPLPDMDGPDEFLWGVQEQRTDIMFTAHNQTEFMLWTQASAFAGVTRVLETHRHTNPTRYTMISPQTLRAAIALENNKQRESDTVHAVEAEAKAGRSTSKANEQVGGGSTDNPSTPASPPSPIPGRKIAARLRTWSQRRASRRESSSSSLQSTDTQNKKTVTKTRSWYNLYTKVRVIRQSCTLPPRHWNTTQSIFP